MKRNIFSLSLVLILGAGISIAQQSLPARMVNPGPGVKKQNWSGKMFNPNVAMVFDSSGKLIYFPPAVASKRKHLCYETVVPGKFMQQQIAQFRDNLIATMSFFQESQNLTAAYYCFLRETGRTDKFDVEFEDNQAQKQKQTVTGDRRFFDFLNDLAKAIPLLQTYAQRGVPSVADIEKDFHSFKYFPAESFLKNLFYHQYQVQVKNGDDSVKYTTLVPIYDNKNKCFRFGADCDKLGSLTCGNCGVPDAEQLNVELVRTDPFTQTLKEWFEVQNKFLGDLATRPAAERALNAIAKIEQDDASFQGLLIGLKDVKPWFINWFWYTHGEFTVDPFQVMNKNGITALQGSIKKIDRDLTLLRQQKTFMDSVLTKVPFSFFSFYLFKLAQVHTQTIADSINTLTEKRKTAEKALSARSPLFPATQPRLLLNQANIILSEAKQVRPQIQFNAARKYRSVVYSKRQAHRVSELPDNEQGYLMVHNLDSSIQFKIDQQRMPFKDDEEFTQVVAEQIDKILNAGVTSGPTGNLQQFFKELFPTVNPAAFKGAAGETIPFVTLCDQVDLAPAHGKIKKLADAFAANQLTMFYKATPFTEDDPTAPRFRTHTEMIKFNTDSPFKDSVSATQITGGKSSQAFATNVNVGKLRFVQIAFGIVVSSNPVNTTAIDTTGGGFRVSSSDNRAKAVAGFKLYPFQSYNRDRWLLPRYPLHRFSVFGGFEILHPLDNFYAGGAYDIVPGLAFSAGKNFYLQTSRRIENNTVTETHRSYEQAKGLYFSVVVNPVIFIKFTTLFFKSL